MPANTEHHDDAPKITKKAAEYRPSRSLRRRCGTCDMFVRSKMQCTLVKGIIDPLMVCKYWEEKGSADGRKS